MSENEKKDETILDIIDIMQDFDCDGGWCNSMEDLAGRLREAWKRHLKKEQEDRLSLQHTIAELTKSIADAGETIEAQKAKLVELFSRTGDVAEMRDALEKAQRNFDEIGLVALTHNIPIDALLQVCAKMSSRCESALSAPPRNCDRFIAPGDAVNAFLHEGLNGWQPGNEEQNAFWQFAQWLFATAEGGEK